MCGRRVCDRDPEVTGSAQPGFTCLGAGFWGGKLPNGGVWVKPPFPLQLALVSRAASTLPFLFPWDFSGKRLG